MRRAALASTVMVLASLGCRHQFPISSADGPVVGDASTGLDGHQILFPDGPRLDGESRKPDLLPGRDVKVGTDLTAGPLVSWSKVPSGTSIATGSCQQGPLLGGGGSCAGGGAIGSLGPGDASTYVAQCGSGANAEVYAACLNAAAKVTTVTVPTATALCTGGTTLVGGGCTCSAGGKLVASFPDPNSKSWVCDCGASTGLTHAICAVVPTGIKLLLYQGASCVGPELVLGGGCACPAGAGIVLSIPVSPPWPLAWQCACDAGQPVTYVICAS